MAKRERKSLLSTISKPVEKVNNVKTVENKEDILRELKAEKTVKKEAPKPKVKKKPVRVSVDFPRDLYRIMKDDTEEQGQTLKGFIVSMVRSHYAGKGKL